MKKVTFRESQIIRPVEQNTYQFMLMLHFAVFTGWQSNSFWCCIKEINKKQVAQ